MRVVNFWPHQSLSTGALIPSRKSTEGLFLVYMPMGWSRVPVLSQAARSPAYWRCQPEQLHQAPSRETRAANVHKSKQNHCWVLWQNRHSTVSSTCSRERTSLFYQPNLRWDSKEEEKGSQLRAGWSLMPIRGQHMSSHSYPLTERDTSSEIFRTIPFWLLSKTRYILAKTTCETKFLQA